MDKKFNNKPQRIEAEPDTSNVYFMDEYPRLTERLRLRRLAQPAQYNRPSTIGAVPQADLNRLPQPANHPAGPMSGTTAPRPGHGIKTIAILPAAARRPNASTHHTNI